MGKIYVAKTTFLSKDRVKTAIENAYNQYLLRPLPFLYTQQSEFSLGNPLEKFLWRMFVHQEPTASFASILWAPDSCNSD